MRTSRPVWLVLLLTLAGCTPKQQQGKLAPPTQPAPVKSSDGSVGLDHTQPVAAGEIVAEGEFKGAATALLAALDGLFPNAGIGISWDEAQLTVWLHTVSWATACISHAEGDRQIPMYDQVARACLDAHGPPTRTLAVKVTNDFYTREWSAPSAKLGPEFGHITEGPPSPDDPDPDLKIEPDESGGLQSEEPPPETFPDAYFRVSPEFKQAAEKLRRRLERKHPDIEFRIAWNSDTLHVHFSGSRTELRDPEDPLSGWTYSHGNIWADVIEAATSIDAPPTATIWMSEDGGGSEMGAWSAYAEAYTDAENAP